MKTTTHRVLQSIIIILILSCYMTSVIHGSSRSFSCSIDDLQELALSDFIVVDKLRQIVGNVTTNEVADSSLLHHIDKYLQDFYAGNGLDINWSSLNDKERDEQVKRVANNPISSYRLIRRYAYYLPYILNQIKTFTDAEFIMTKGQWPDQDDIDGAIGGILRLHHVYNFKAAEFARGNLISGKQEQSHLNGVHCYEIGAFGKNQGFYSLSIEWLELAQELAILDGTVDHGYVISELLYAKKLHDKAEAQAEGWEPLFYTLPFSYMDKVHGNKTIKISLREKRRQQQYDAFKGRRESNFVNVNYWGLCSGENLQTEYEKSLLFCWLEKKIHPFFHISPMKMEFLSINPDVVQIYDAIGHELAERIKKKAKAKFERSRVVNFNKSEGVDRKIVSGRNSMNAWLPDLTPELSSVPKLIGYLTRLETLSSESAEQIQIASYTFTGQYESHVDSLLTESSYGGAGDRIATFMFYLNDVEEGGKTAFTKIGTAANPIKNSALFWFDTTSDGQTDFGMYHAACPCLKGRKYVANKWIRYFDQHKLFPCSLNPRERYRFPVNGRILPNPKRRQEISPLNDLENLLKF